MTADPFTQWDAAYVLGALTPSDRREYESHLGRCTDCAAAVAELAGMPGLLSRASEEVLEASAGAGPAPDTMLPRLLRTARGERRRNTLRTAVAGGVAAALIVLAVVIGVGVTGGSPAPAGRSVTLTAVQDLPVRASVSVQGAASGTRLDVRCTYSGSLPSSGPYGRVVYRLVAVPTGGGPGRAVAQWAVVPGQEVRVQGSTDLAPSDIAQLRLETTDGTVIMRGALPA